jgi:hypothetical protein
MVAALRRISFFHSLTDPDLSRLARIGRRRSYAAGDAMVEKDSDRGGLFGILSGGGGGGGRRRPHARTRRFLRGDGAPRGIASNRNGPCDGAGRSDGGRDDAFRAFLIENPSVAVTLLEGVVDRLNAAQQRLHGLIRTRAREDRREHLGELSPGDMALSSPFDDVARHSGTRRYGPSAGGEPAASVP